ncbi:hypothetical protein AB237_1076 [Acinetobacter baumannii NCGM 237]|nr:hypothetical protein AB237_1076 [Acinetobacter baumannii NCGM 237]
MKLMNRFNRYEFTIVFIIFNCKSIAQPNIAQTAFFIVIHNLAYSLNVVTTTENSPFSLCLIATAVVMYSPAVRTETFNWQSPRVFGYGPSVISPCSKQQIICFIEIQRSFILSFACAVNLILLVSLANALSFCLASVNVKHIQANTKVLGKSKRMLNRQILTVR